MDTHPSHHGAHVLARRLQSLVYAHRRPAPATGDEHTRARTYRRFLRRTQDVGAAGRAYPGGIASLIRDREVVTDLLVDLLQGAARD
ncbi:MAG: hypothetical protein B6D46_09080 [Polyangiaceae bacterium UTPRO1]|jgi:hypothetical protein|nr:hypothetical protein [Myxococcales bacterium]OQY66877.1 MAG: hypothetical protein B6D46_09080 [Polyangiaceae bacterium UTPRO1]